MTTSKYRPRLESGLGRGRRRGIVTSGGGAASPGRGRRVSCLLSAHCTSTPWRTLTHTLRPLITASRTTLRLCTTIHYHTTTVRDERRAPWTPMHCAPGRNSCETPGAGGAPTRAQSPLVRFCPSRPAPYTPAGCRNAADTGDPVAADATCRKKQRQSHDAAQCRDSCELAKLNEPTQSAVDAADAGGTKSPIKPVIHYDVLVNR
ncbi:hypothetical protein RR48_06308 [Papilio machaon]|uniref:Uncharacterized protein n=1 Tax=Papilio machaon TaxID=76193 RepID=A0A194QZ02_PAPMA|nr:hypothetical protein RR48_06308 [Papilio machaon]